MAQMGNLRILVDGVLSSENVWNFASTNWYGSNPDNQFVGATI